MRQAFVDLTTRRLVESPRLALVLADIGEARFQEALAACPERVFNVGIREALAVGAAAGLALEGYQPLVHTYAPFLVERAFEQIKLDLVHQDVSAVLVSIGAAYDASVEGRTHQCPADVALMASLGLHVEVPGHPKEVEASMDRAIRSGRAAYVRLSEQSNLEPLPAPLTVVRRGQRGTVLVLGPLLDPTLRAARALDLGVVYSPTAYPLPEDLPAALGLGPLAVVEPALEGSSLPALAERLGPRAILAVGVGRRELRRYGTPAQHAAAHGLDARGLHARLSGLRDSEGQA
ncbi:MAG: transketolase [Myxococcota bacterium]